MRHNQNEKGDRSQLHRSAPFVVGQPAFCLFLPLSWVLLVGSPRALPARGASPVPRRLPSQARRAPSVGGRDADSPFTLKKSRRTVWRPHHQATTERGAGPARSVSTFDFKVRTGTQHGSWQKVLSSPRSYSVGPYECLASKSTFIPK